MAAKRFTDTEKYKKPFVRGLEGAYKLLWDYLYHDCDNAGIWIKDFEIAKYYLGKDLDITESKALKIFNKGEIRVVPFDSGRKWWLPGFIEFQYDCRVDDLNPNNKAHYSVIKKIEKYDLVKGLESLSEGDKEKDKDKDKDNTKRAFAEFVKMTEKEYQKLIDKCGNELIVKKCIEVLNHYKGSKGKTYRSDYHTILNWVLKKVKEEHPELLNIYNPTENIRKQTGEIK